MKSYSALLRSSVGEPQKFNSHLFCWRPALKGHRGELTGKFAYALDRNGVPPLLIG